MPENTEWDFIAADKWGETTRIYPDGRVVRLSRIVSGQWIADRFPNAHAADLGLWDESDPALAGGLWTDAVSASRAADASA
jgi:hypothetical protein